jgi:hypothetical protein
MKINRKNKWTAWFTLLAILVSFSVQAAPKMIDVSTQNRSMSAFTSIKLMCSADLYITQGNTQSVTVKADDKVINDLKTEVRNGVLIIDMKRSYGFFNNIRVLEVHVTVPKLEKVADFGSGDIQIKNGFKASDFTVTLNGSGDLTADLHVQNMKLMIRGSGDAKFQGVSGSFELSVMGSGDVEGHGLDLSSCSVDNLGSGDVELSGSTSDLSLSLKGSGDFNGYGMKTKTASVTSYGSGDALVNVTESIRARLFGSGDVIYRGDAPKVSVSSMGSGEVYKK